MANSWNYAVAFSMALASIPRLGNAIQVADLSGNPGLSLPPTSAEMVRVIPYPFETVHHAWENGPQDEKFIREDRKEVWNGQELSVTKTIYTRNPFPYVIAKTVIRDKQLIWYEEQKINKKQRYASYMTVNKSLDGLGKAYRKATMRADPNNPGWTIFEQSGGVVLRGEYPRALKETIESFACNAFLSVCRCASDTLRAGLDAVHAQNKSASSTEAVECVTSLKNEGVASKSKREKLALHRGLLGLIGWLVAHPSVILGALMSPLVAHHLDHNTVAASSNTCSKTRQDKANPPLRHVQRQRSAEFNTLVGAAAAFVTTCS